MAAKITAKVSEIPGQEGGSINAQKTRFSTSTLLVGIYVIVE